jgi:predicted nuclease of predicted toxin-antitoxin system
VRSDSRRTSFGERLASKSNFNETFARAHTFLIQASRNSRRILSSGMTADADFDQLLEQRGPPPKIIRIENCNFRTAEVENLVRRNAIRIAEFERSDAALLVLRKPV